MATQANIWADVEGDRWYARNKHKFPIAGDPVLKVIEGLTPQRVLEVGCSDGWRLNEIQKRYGSDCVGCDMSGLALYDGRTKHPNVRLYYCNARDLRYSEDSEFDLVIYGFCFYAMDREDLFRAVAEADRVLCDGGHLVIYDFWNGTPIKVPYHHDDRLMTYKMDYPSLFMCNPAYEFVSYQFDFEENTGAWLLKKDIDLGWPG